MAVDAVKQKTSKAFRKPMLFFNPVQFDILKLCIESNPQSQNDLIKVLTKKFRTYPQYIYQMIWKLKKEQFIEVRKTYPATVIMPDNVKEKMVNYLSALDALFDLKLRGKRNEKVVSLQSSRALSEIRNGKPVEEQNEGKLI